MKKHGSRHGGNTRKIALLFCCLCIVFCLIPSTARAEQSGQVLLLCSYHQGDLWTDKIVEGVQSVFSGSDVDLHIEYLDARRHKDVNWLQAFKSGLAYKYKKHPSRVIICADDAALNFLLKHRDDLFTNIPIVFCGINNFHPTRIAGHRNITGVNEALDIAETIEMALRLQPEARHLVAITSDRQPHWRANAVAFRELIPAFSKRIHIRELKNLTLADAPAALGAISPDSIVLALSLQLEDEMKHLDIEETYRFFSKHSAAPVYALWSTGIGNGVLGGKMVSGFHQGEAAARIALRILAGEPASKIPVVLESPNVTMVDWGVMKRFGIREKDLPPGSQVLFKVPSLYEQYRIWFWIIPGLIILEALLIAGLLMNRFRRIRTEQFLRESEEKFRDLYDNAPNAYFSISASDGSILRCNNAAVNLLGYDKETLIGMKAFDLYADTSQGKLKARGIFERFKRGESIKDEELQIKRKSGDHILTSLSVEPLRDHDGKVIASRSVLIDISDRKRAEKVLRESQEKLARAKKMEAIGLMAGGVAHDLNNILSGIVSYPELLLMDLPANSPLRKPIETIKESGIKAADVVADLLTITRGVATGKESLNFNTIVTEYLGSAEHERLEEIHSFVDIKVELDPDLLNISGSPTHIKKTLMNLVTNASEAIEGSGTVTVSTSSRYLDEPLKGYEDVRQGEYAVLTVSDDGSGIAPGDLERIFEPFYTKKVMGRSGTGLGLAVVWNTVQDHKGYINVKSSETGTVLELYFPATREEVAAEKEEVPLEDYLGHGEKILVVDDEERQREIATGMLTRLGYYAQSLSSGEEAIEYLKENPVDLIALDMVMPKGINGLETYEEIIKIRPGQKAIIASGYAKTNEVDLAQKLGAGKYIKKPYTLAKIGLAVKEELEK